MSKVRVLYNATFVRVGGALTYVVNQVRSLAVVEGIELTVLCAPWNRADLDVLDPIVDLRTIRVQNAGVRFAWEQLLLPVLARRHDVLLCPGNFSPLLPLGPTVTVIQNANYVGHGRHLPQNLTPARRTKVALSHLSMRRADLVVAVSNALAHEISREPGLSGVEVEVIPSGAPRPPEPGSLSSSVPPDPFAAPTELPYLLSVANDYPHKRLADLAHLVPLLDDQPPEVPRRVVLVGSVTEERQRQLRTLARPFPDRLEFLGAMNDHERVLDLTRRAAASVATSELESWGFTLHEAGSLGCRLVVSDIPAHREVADGRASFFPVGDIAILLERLQRSLAEPPPSPWSNEWGWADHGRQLAQALARVAERHRNR